MCTRHTARLAVDCEQSALNNEIQLQPRVRSAVHGVNSVQRGRLRSSSSGSCCIGLFSSTFDCSSAISTCLLVAITDSGSGTSRDVFFHSICQSPPRCIWEYTNSALQNSQQGLVRADQLGTYVQSTYLPDTQIRTCLSTSTKLLLKYCTSRSSSIQSTPYRRVHVRTPP